MPKAANRRDAFRAWLASQNLLVPDVARRSGVPKTTLYSYLDGKSQSMKGTNEQLIAEAFDTTIERIFTFRLSATAEVGVWGKVGAGAEIFPLTDYTAVPMYKVNLPPGLDPDDEYVAFEIEGFSMPPAEPGYVVIFRKVEISPLELVNTPCLIDTSDGRRLFKRLRRGYGDGLFNLESWDGSPLIENVTVLVALPFAAMTPGRKAR